LPFSKAAIAGLLSASVTCCAYAPADAGATTTPSANTATPGPNLLNNGKFSLPAKYNGNIQAPQYGSIPGWATGGSGVQDWSSLVRAFQAPPNAVQVVLLADGETAGTLSQTVKTTAGWTYLLQWYESGYPNDYGPPIKGVHVLWGGALVAAPSLNAKDFTNADMHWTLRREVLTATSASSTLEFADATVPESGFAGIVANASLAGDAKLYLPASTNVARTGKVIAIVRTATGAPLDYPGLAVKLYGTWKETSYAPASTQLISTGTVVNGQYVLHLDLPAILVGHTIPAYATLSGPGFIPVTDHLSIKIS
jgi:hypothetical protein